jgi:hypothetical protein
MSDDKLTADERAFFEAYKSHPLSVQEDRVARIIDRLAPAPRPPEPLPHELPARWRAAEGRQRDQADYAWELEAALNRERERREARLRSEVFIDSAAHNVQKYVGGTWEAACWAAGAIRDALLSDKELWP